MTGRDHALPTCILAAAAAFTTIPPAHAAESYDSCGGFITSLPATITSQGVWCMDRNLATAIASGSAITIDANNVTLDCNGFKLGGLAAGTATDAIGVEILPRMNTTVRNCNIRGFRSGLYSSYGGGATLVEDNRFDGNTRYGLLVYSAGSMVRRNTVVDTGHGTLHALPVMGIILGYGVDAVDNAVSGVSPPSIPGEEDVFGIYSLSNDESVISGNRIRELRPGAGTGYGIYHTNSDSGGVISGNHILGGIGTVTRGVVCDSLAVTSVQNVFAGIDVPVTGCHSIGDLINPN